MPRINGIGQNNPPLQMNEAPQAAENAPVQNPPAPASRLARAGWMVLGVATLGLSAIVRSMVQSHRTAPRVVNPQLPALSAADRRANGLLAAKVRLQMLPDKVQMRLHSAMARLREKLPAAEITDDVRKAWATRIERCTTKVSSRLAVDFLTDLVRGEYLQHNILNDLVAEKSAQLAASFQSDARLTRNLAKVLAGSPQVLKLASRFNFHRPEDCNAFKARLSSIVEEQVSIVFSAERKIAAVTNDAVAKIARYANLPPDDARQNLAQSFATGLRKQLKAVVNDFPRDPQTWLPKLSKLPALSQKIDEAAEAVIAEKRAVIDSLRNAGLSPAMQSEWMKGIFDDNVFMTPASAALYSDIARDLADGPQVARLMTLLGGNAPYSADDAKQCFLEMLQTVRTRLSQGLDRDLKHRLDGNAFITVLRDLFAVVYERKPELARLLTEKRGEMADLAEALQASGDRHELLFAQSVFHPAATHSIEALLEERNAERADAGRRVALQRALAGGAAPLAEVRQAREALAALFGDAVLEDVNAEPGLHLDGRHEAGAQAALQALLDSGERVRPNLVRERYQAVVTENYVTALLTAAAAPMAAELGNGFTPDLRALCRHPDIQARLAALATPEDVTRLIADLTPVLREYVTAAKSLSDQAVALYDAQVAHLAERSGVAKADVRKSLPLDDFTQQLLKDFAAAPGLHFAEAARAESARLSEKVAALTAAWDARFAAIDAAPVADEVKTAWRREAVLANAFADPADVAHVVAAADMISTRTLEKALAESLRQRPEDTALLLRGEMHRISDTLRRCAGRDNIAPDVMDGLRTALITLLYSRNDHRIPQHLAYQSESVINAIFTLDEDVLSKKLDAELARFDPLQAARIKALEMDNARRCRLFWSPEHPQTAGFAQQLEAARAKRHQLWIAEHNNALYDTFWNGPIPESVQTSLDAMKEALRAKFGDAVVPAGRGYVDNPEDLKQFLWFEIHESPVSLTYPECVERLQDWLIRRHLEKTVVKPVLAELASRRPGVATDVNGIVSRLINSPLIKTLGDAVENQDLGPAREAVREAAVEQIRVMDCFQKEKEALLAQYASKLAYETENDAQELRDHPENLFKKLEAKLERELKRLPVKPETGLWDEAALPKLRQSMEKIGAEHLAQKMAVWQSVEALDLPEAAKSAWHASLLENDAFFNSNVVAVTMKAGRAAAGLEGAQRLAAVLSAPDFDKADAKRLMASLMERILTTYSDELTPAENAKAMDCDSIGPILIQALSVFYAARPDVADAVNQHPDRMKVLIDELSANLISRPEQTAGLYFLQPQVVSATYAVVSSEQQDDNSAAYRAMIVQAINERRELPDMYEDSLTKAIDQLRSRFGTALAPEGVTAARMPFAKEAWAAVRARVAHFVSADELADLFARKVTEAYIRTGLLPALLRSVVADDGIDATEEDITATARLVAEQSRSAQTILGALQSEDDLDEAEFMLRPVLRQAFQQQKALAQTREATLLATRRAIADLAGVPVGAPEVAQLDLSVVASAMSPAGEGLSLDAETGLPDREGAATIAARGEAAKNAKMDNWRAIFASINGLPQATDALKAAWRRDALTDPLLQDPAKIEALAGLAQQLSAEGLAQTLDAYPFPAADFIQHLTAMDATLEAALAADPRWTNADEGLRQSARQHLLSAFLAANPAVAAKLQTRKDVVIEAFRGLFAGAFPDVTVTQSQHLAQLLAVPELADVRRSVYDESRPTGWDFLEQGEFPRHPLPV